VKSAIDLGVNVKSKGAKMQSAIANIYLPDDLYDEVVSRLAEVMPLVGSRDDLVAKLGELTGIWPAYTRGGEANDEIRHAA